MRKGGAAFQLLRRRQNEPRAFLYVFDLLAPQKQQAAPSPKKKIGSSRLMSLASSALSVFALTTLRPFSEIENALALGPKAGCAFNVR